jgi:hypothetical protein
MPEVIHFEIPGTIRNVLLNSTARSSVGSLINGRARRIIGSLQPERENQASMAGCYGTPSWRWNG